MTPDEVIKLNPEQQKHLKAYIYNVYTFLGGNALNLRSGLEWRDRLYYRETDYTAAQMKARMANMLGDAQKLQNMVVPVVAPQVETAVGYLTEVFCTGEPFFGVVAPRASVDAATQMETVISDNSRRFGWRAEVIKAFRDGLKYNLMATEVAWETKKTYTIINNPALGLKDGAQTAEEMYAGNFVKRMDLYNMILDTRVPPNKIHTHGEFVGYVELLPRTALKQLTIDLGAGNTMNLTDAFQSNCNQYTVGAAASGEYYIPLVNPAALLNMNSGTGGANNWLAWISGITNNGVIEYRDLYEVATIYARFLPSDFKLKLPADNTPQIFKLIVVNKQWIVFCKRMTNAHNFLPIIVSQPFDDGLGYQAKSFADNVSPYQEMASALWNSGIESKRRLVYDRLFYDPSRINKTDIDKVSSVARIPVKQAAYGKPVSDAVHSLNYRDDNVVGVLEMAQRVQQLANVANGQNNAQQGQFQKGNKTRFEFETTMSGANMRPRLFAITLEDTFFAAFKEIVKMNIIQYQGPAEIYSIPKDSTVKIDPLELRKGSFQFKLSDGQTPTEKLLNTELMGQVAQIGMAVPAINAEYDVVGMLTYSWKQNGAFWLDEFKRTPEQKAEYLQTLAATSTAEATPDKRQPAPPPAAAQ
jgi:hypothetical protein